MSKPDFKVTTTGTFFGIKVNTTGGYLSKILRRSDFKRDGLLKKIMPLFTKRLQKRIPKLKEQLMNGLQGSIGTRRFESSVRGTHKPHRDIPDPLSRIIEKGTSFKLQTKKDRLQVLIKPHDRRNGYINFHGKMSKVPRISTVANRLDATCLPFWSNGHADAVYRKWLNYSRIGFYYALDDFVKGMDTSGSEK